LKIAHYCTLIFAIVVVSTKPGLGPGSEDIQQETPEEIAKQIIALNQRGRIKLFYKLGIWRRKRRQILDRDNHECQKCKAAGGYRRATCVHHIKHLDKAPHLALTDSNLISLCDACHNEEHPEKLKRQQANRREHITPERW